MYSYSMEPNPPTRFPKNVPGDFYTLGTCLACEAPEAEAPDLLALLNDENYHTYFVKQPETEAEIERACCAIKVCCVAALRYGGTDTKIIRRLGNTAKHSDYVVIWERLVFVGQRHLKFTTQKYHFTTWHRMWFWLRSWF